MLTTGNDDGDLQRRDSMSDAFGDTAKIAIKLAALESKLKAAGCPVDGGGKFREVKSEMTESSSSGATGNGEVRFEPGKPMIDVSTNSTR